LRNASIYALLIASTSRVHSLQKKLSVQIDFGAASCYLARWLVMTQRAVISGEIKNPLFSVTKKFTGLQKKAGF
jgi:hypothetical protein